MTTYCTHNDDCGDINYYCDTAFVSACTSCARAACDPRTGVTTECCTECRDYAQNNGIDCKTTTSPPTTSTTDGIHTTKKVRNGRKVRNNRRRHRCPRNSTKKRKRCKKARKNKYRSKKVNKGERRTIKQRRHLIDDYSGELENWNVGMKSQLTFTTNTLPYRMSNGSNINIQLAPARVYAGDHSASQQQVSPLMVTSLSLFTVSLFIIVVLVIAIMWFYKKIKAGKNKKSYSTKQDELLINSMEKGEKSNGLFTRNLYVPVIHTDGYTKMSNYLMKTPDDDQISADNQVTTTDLVTAPEKTKIPPEK